MESAERNADKGSLNREMAIALLEDVKKNMHDINDHINKELEQGDSDPDQQGRGEFVQLHNK